MSPFTAYTMAMHEKRELWKMGILATCQLSGKAHLKLWGSFQAVNRLTHSLWDGIMKKLTIRLQCCAVGMNAVGHSGWDSAVASGAPVGRKYHFCFSHFMVKKGWLTSAARWFLQWFTQGFAAKRSPHNKAVFFLELKLTGWQAAAYLLLTSIFRGQSAAVMTAGSNAGEGNYSKCHSCFRLKPCWHWEKPAVQCISIDLSTDTEPEVRASICRRRKGKYYGLIKALGTNWEWLWGNTNSIWALPRWL